VTLTIAVFVVFAILYALAALAARRQHDNEHDHPFGRYDPPSSVRRIHAPRRPYDYEQDA
jgi:hypothetical protein